MTRYRRFSKRKSKKFGKPWGRAELREAGRANPALLDRVEVNYYGTPTPLKQLANISCPDPRTIMISPLRPESGKGNRACRAGSKLGNQPDQRR